MKLKLDAEGNVVVQDGKPVYVKEDGTEVVFDVVGTTQTIARLNSEAKGHRERAEKAESAVKAFEGLDPEAARTALETVSKLDAKKLVDAGKVDEVIAATNKAWETKFAAQSDELKKATDLLYREKIGGSFARSKYVGEKLAVPVDMVEATFGKHFSLDNGNIIAKDANGNAIYSASNPGNPAGFDEALEILVSQYQHKDSILKSDQKPGGGAPAGGGGGGNSKTMKRADFEALSPQARMESMKGGTTLVD